MSWTAILPAGPCPDSETMMKLYLTGSLPNGILPSLPKLMELRSETADEDELNGTTPNWEVDFVAKM